MNQKINNKCFSCIIFFISEYMFLGTGFNQILTESKNNSLICLIIGFIVSIILFKFIINIFNYESNLNIIEKVDKIYGKVFGKIINYILLITILFLFIYTLWNTQIYIQNKYLDKTPNYVILILFLLPIIYVINKGFNTFTKLSLMIFIISLIEIFLVFIGIIPYIEIDNYKPLFNSSFICSIKSIYYFVSFFISPIYLILLLPKSNIDKKDHFNFFYVLSFLNIFLLAASIIGTFSVELSSILNYPEFVLVKKINYFNFIQHIENILSTQWLYTMFIFATMCLFYIKTFFENKKINIKLLYFLIFISFIISLNLFTNTTLGYNFIHTYYHIISFFILMFIIITNILIKN